MTNKYHTQQMEVKEHQQHLQMQQMHFLEQRNAQIRRRDPNQPPLGGHVNAMNNDGMGKPSPSTLGGMKTYEESMKPSPMRNLHLNTMHDELVETLKFAGRLMDLCGNDRNGETSLCLVEAQLKHLYSLLDLMITFGNGLLNDFMVAHRTLSMVTHVLAKIFASLYLQGFGGPTENQE